MSGGRRLLGAAALLAEQGHDVIGLSMQLYDQRGGEQAWGTCCTSTISRTRGAWPPLSAFLTTSSISSGSSGDGHLELRGGVRGRRHAACPARTATAILKFSTLLDRARGLGAEQVATGHYARVDRSPDGRWLLKRSADPEKDQSYFLFSLTQDQLARAVFPVGLLSKSQVRAKAHRLGLAVADKPDSQEICFVPDGDYASFVARKEPSVVRSGAIVDEEGRHLGTHGGVHRFTVGQRKGLGISASSPLYVLKIDAEASTVTVGAREALDNSRLVASGVNWIAIDAGGSPMRVAAQIRTRHKPGAGASRAPDGRAEMIFDEPQPARSPR